MAAAKGGLALGRRPYCKLVAGVLRDLGVVKCQLGEMAAGCQLLRESAGLYQWTPRHSDDKLDQQQQQQQQLTVDDVISIAEVSSHSSESTCIFILS